MPSDLPDLFVGDHVHDREDEDAAPMAVVGTPLETADEYVVDSGVESTVEDYNPEYPAGDDVVEVKFAERTCVDLSHPQSYAYPRSRLVLDEPVHNIEEDH